MNKKLLYSLIASLSMISIGAHANDASESALTTKGYVDAGLKFVYDDLKPIVGNEADAEHNIPASGLVKKVADLEDDVDGINDTIGDTPMGTEANTITGAIKELNNAIGELEGASQTYNEGAGIKITPGANEGDPATIGLKVGNAADTTYVYKTNGEGTGSWQALEVEDSWSSAFLTE